MQGKNVKGNAGKNKISGSSKTVQNRQLKIRTNVQIHR